MLQEPITWTEKSIGLIKVTLGFSRRFFHKVVLEKAIFEIERLTESSDTLLFSIEDSDLISILAAKDFEVEGNLIEPRLFYDIYNSENIQIRKLPPEDSNKANILINSSYILVIPLKEECFNGLLVLGFKAIPPDIDGLHEFGEIVQNLFLEIFYLESLKSAQNKTKKSSPSEFKNINPVVTPFDSKKNQTDILSLQKDKSIEPFTGSKIIQKDPLFDGILKNLPVIVFRLGDNGLLLEMHGKGLERLDLKGNQHLGLNIYDLIPKLDFPELFFKNNRVARLTLKRSISETLVVFDFHFFPYEINPGEYIGFGIDISDQYFLKKKLKQAKKIADKARFAKSFFLANQSHEIRTFIHSILGFAHLIKNKDWSEESEEYLDFIISSGQILLNILGNILDLTKIEEGKLELVEEPFNFMEDINSCLSPFQFQAKEKGLRFTVNFDKDFPKYFLGDGVKLIQIVVNLVSNSIKFTEKGEINISFSCLSRPIEGEKIKIGIVVSDTGIGISKSRQKKIFRNFSQAEPSIHRRFGGSGLGLSIVKKLVNLMGGEIEVRSPSDISSNTGGVGSTFWLSVNLHVTYPPSSDLENDAGKVNINYNEVLKVLLVDDNYLNQRLTSTILKNLGCEVTLANNGKEALQELKQNDFHLIFMDVQMPVLDGYQTTRAIRENLKLNLPIIGLSANVYKEDIDLCFESGMDDYLGRPYTIKNFEEKVYKWAPQIEQIEDLVIFEDADNSNFGKLTELEYLARVFDGDLEMMKDLIQNFLIHHQMMISDLKNAIFSKDYALVATLAHDIRSTLQTIGLHSLVQILIDIEINAKETKNDSELVRQFSIVKETSEEASLELKEFLSN